ncbi:hypothetical protein L3V43_17695 [Pseudoalteromonas sp. L23]|uniref:hypothetical protein n=1 Tax=unclassified Pseudoalteromonas TaxID=194690 RepID=UPI001EF149A3|nr:MULTISPECIES: hypothetical protein [unclassified Pseudoalteromonas]MCF7515337.1 hypothetical protein [Pseudoalteromonas sp. L7]MCF7527484.1 hypothetical protein [Pseudoalteromonas sp. L23]MCX2767598.1 hypothetical protein [Pseudoalteromonas sp. B530]
MKTAFIENSPLSFEDFHDRDWIKELFSLTESSGFKDNIDDFAAQWWGSARMFTLPWLLVSGVHSLAEEHRPVSLDQVWNEYLKIDGFNGALWKTAENAYCSLYYAYENLVVSILAKLSGDKVRVTDRNFHRTFSSCLSEKLLGNVWSSPKVVLAKEIRNSIVHNGGKCTPKLERLKFSSLSETGDVMISASDTRELYNFLKPLVMMVVKSAVERESS